MGGAADEPVTLSCADFLAFWEAIKEPSEREAENLLDLRLRFERDCKTKGTMCGTAGEECLYHEGRAAEAAVKEFDKLDGRTSWLKFMVFKRPARPYVRERRGEPERCPCGNTLLEKKKREWWCPQCGNWVGRPQLSSVDTESRGVGDDRALWPATDTHMLLSWVGQEWQELLPGIREKFEKHCVEQKVPAERPKYREKPPRQYCATLLAGDILAAVSHITDVEWDDMIADGLNRRGNDKEPLKEWLDLRHERRCGIAGDLSVQDKRRTNRRDKHNSETRKKARKILAAVGAPEWAADAFGLPYPRAATPASEPAQGVFNDRA